MARHLTAAQVDEVIAALHKKDGEWVSRGRGGEGFASRGGELFRVWVDESEHQESPISEPDLRALLTNVDLDDFGERHKVGAIQQLGIAIASTPLPQPQ